ncbi:MFS transporter [Streptomyces mobaraensis]|uniref:NarK/NasA family nitrate transporter n=1 Tax=Streptomyces mobaraensis TaxID=35621 RepID=A0A5N5W718_STRMB|nr:MFS transporter [Streptomyces mobaraensis]KAB7843760.1 NarK/NasA family nitrate transporter [Streptomyces mobaraensis]
MNPLTPAAERAHEPPAAPASRRRRRRRVEDWRPDDPAFWAAGGARIARRNLVLSVLCEHIGFSVWSLWSVLVLFLGPEYGIDPAGKFLLTAVPTLVGGALRLPYTVAVAVFGGRTWTVISAAVLLVPTVLTAVVLEPGVSYSTLVLVAAVAGVGGGNFASSMANINAFYPQHLKGRALGVNAGGGNLGVPAVQLLGLLVLGTAGAGHPRLIVLLYIPLIVLAALAAALRMDDLGGPRPPGRPLREVARQGHTWTVSLLYIGTFGSFIGFGFAFGQVLLVQFPDAFPTPVRAASLTFLGPLLGSLVRPLGGVLADRWGGARVTFWTFAAMAGSTALVVAASREGSLSLFLTGYVLLFFLSGVGNGSTYKMIPALHRAAARRRVAAGVESEAAYRLAHQHANAAMGVAGAVGALGGVLINVAFRQAFLSGGSGKPAYLAFLAWYVVCLVVTWGVFLRRGAEPV